MAGICRRCQNAVCTTFFLALSFVFFLVVLAGAVLSDARWRLLLFLKQVSTVEAIREWFQYSKYGNNAPGHLSFEQVVALEGYSYETHDVTTEDGYVLTLFRLLPLAEKENGNGNGNTQHRPAVFLQHGLFQTAMPFVFNTRERSLAFYLVDKGFDVFLGNSRGNLHSRKHEKHRTGDAAFWDFSVDDFQHDCMANIAFVKELTGQAEVAYIGHSQGAAQVFQALSSTEVFGKDLSVVVAMSPGGMLNELPSRPLRALSMLYSYSPDYFFLLFGKNAFLGFFEPIRSVLGIRLFTYFAYAMFNYLMDWNDNLWDRSRKLLYFSETPGGVSSRAVAQWMQYAASRKFCRFDHGSQTLNIERYGTPSPPEYPLAHVTAPVALIYGGQDSLINYEKIATGLPNVVHHQCVRHHAHMDNLNAIDAVETVFPQIASILVKASKGHYKQD